MNGVDITHGNDEAEIALHHASRRLILLSLHKCIASRNVALKGNDNSNEEMLMALVTMKRSFFCSGS